MRSSFLHSISSLTAAAAAFVALTASVQAQGAKQKPLTWGPAPTVFPAGAKMAVESGDPTKGGVFVVRFSFPDGYTIPPHFHPTDEHVRVRSGTFLVGMGDKLDAKSTKPLAPGDTGTMPANMHHFGIARGATVVSVRAEGPFAMTYVNPADTPKKP